MPENQASAVPQGDRQRRARPESEDVTDQPAATQIRVEEARRPQWTISSTVEEILLEGSTNRTDMKLNDFLRSNLGEEWVVKRNGNVKMGIFVQNPETFIKKKGLLHTITTSPSYKELEAINKLHCEGVYFLRQWKDHEGKDTLTPLVCGKLDGVLTQVLTKEQLEAEERAKREEERARREEEERHRRAREMKFTISTNIEDVLFKGRVRVKDVKLNDFLLLRFGGKGILVTNRSVSLEEFFKEPARYIPDAEVLKGMKTAVCYLKMGRAVMKELDMEEVLRMLHEKGVVSLEQWRDYGGKDTVTPLAKGTLDAALSEAQISTSVVKSTVLKGYYESVYNASWSHVVEVPGGEGTGMEVREGEPPQSWNYKKVGDTLEKDDSVEQSSAALFRQMVLTSEKGWPYTWNLKGAESACVCYVNCEVERVWQIVKGDLTEWFSSQRGTDFTPKKRVLIGTAGIGKSMNAGSYLLYQLLHYDAERLPMVAYFIGSQSFLFDKITKTVSVYRGDPRIDDVVNISSLRGFKGYIIYDATLASRQPPAGLPCNGWGMIVVTPPNKNEYERWTKKMDATAIVTNCPEESDVRAMCIWMKRNWPLQEQAEYWREVRGRMNKVGPILRSIFGKQACYDRIKACQQAVYGSTASELEHNLGIGCCYSPIDSELSRKLVRVVRVRRGNSIESPLNLLVSPHLERETLSRLENEMKQSDFIFLF
ncbi:retrotransposon hot spot (RHS) protein [Trypanosoma cruzi]|nr:retrotransposon hot spot (RHS) protein [Trypanosoma cruzi]